MKPVTYITVACPKCSKKHRVLPRFLGQQGLCSRCGGTFDLRPREAIAVAGGAEDFQLSAPIEEKEYFIPVSLTSNPMVDKEYERQSRAQTNFLKQPDRGESWIRKILVFLLVLAVVSGLSLLAYWALLKP